MSAEVQLTACGNCGSQFVGFKVRQGKAGRCTASVKCDRCGAATADFTAEQVTALSQAARAWQVGRAYVAQQPGTDLSARALANRKARMAPAEAPRDPLELLARMLVPGSFRIPKETTYRSAPLTAADISGAAGMMRDTFARDAGTAVALQADGVELARLAHRALRRVTRALKHEPRCPLKLNDPADRWRLRLVLHDAVMDMVRPERRVAVSAAAKAVKMRRGDYTVVYRVAAGVLSQALEDARVEFSTRLFAHAS